MPCYSVQPGDWIFVKSYRLCFFAKNMSKHSQTLLDHAKQSATDALKTTSKRAIQKNSRYAIGDLISNKIHDKITEVLRT